MKIRFQKNPPIPRAAIRQWLLDNWSKLSMKSWSGAEVTMWQVYQISTEDLIATPVDFELEGSPELMIEFRMKFQ